MNVNDREIPFIGVIEFTHLNPMPALGGKALVYLPAYVPEEHPLWALDDAEVVDRSVEAIARIHPGFERRLIRAAFVFRERDAQPVCLSGHLENMVPFDTGWPGFHVTDASQIFPEDRGVNNAFRLALRLAAELG